MSTLLRQLLGPTFEAISQKKFRPYWVFILSLNVLVPLVWYLLARQVRYECEFKDQSHREVISAHAYFPEADVRRKAKALCTHFSSKVPRTSCDVRSCQRVAAGTGSGF